MFEQVSNVYIKSDYVFIKGLSCFWSQQIVTKELNSNCKANCEFGKHVGLDR